MGTKVVPAKTQGGAVVPWKDQLAQQAAAAASSEVSESNFLSFRGGVLTFQGVPVEGNKKQFIVLDSAYEHAFYGDYNDGNPVSWPFSPDNPRSPSCYAMGRVESDLAPIKEGEGTPENIVSDACHGCPLNEWGSDPDGGKGKACKNTRRLALIDAQVLEANSVDAIEKAAVHYAKLPVTSGKNFSAFVIQTANVVKRPLHGIIAELSVVPHQTRQFEIRWQFVDVVPDDLIMAIMAKRDKLADDILFPYPSNEEREQQAAQAPAGQAKYAPPKAATKPAKPTTAPQKPRK